MGYYVKITLRYHVEVRVHCTFNLLKSIVNIFQIRELSYSKKACIMCQEFNQTILFTYVRLKVLFKAYIHRSDLPCTCFCLRSLIYRKQLSFQNSFSFPMVTLTKSNNEFQEYLLHVFGSFWEPSKNTGVFTLGKYRTLSFSVMPKKLRTNHNSNFF